MRWRPPVLVTLCLLAASPACSSAGATDDPTDAGGAGGSAGSSAGGTDAGDSGTGGSAGSGVQLGGSGGAPVDGDDPTTCDEAAARRTYVGCDYWPTVTTNSVSSVFDYAVVVANTGSQPAALSVTRGDQAIGQTTVAPGSLTKLFLPWVPELKGPDNDCGKPTALTSSLGVKQGAYHLVSDRPVAVYQFNALEYKGEGGPPGKSWSNCVSCGGLAIGDCYSYSNDASLLLPSTALTGNYRLAAPKGAVFPVLPGYDMGGYFAVTGTADNTSVKVRLSATAAILAGAGLPAAGPGEVVTFTLNRGDVVELAAPAQADLSGSQIQADKPVQIIAGIPCVTVDGASACDHLEESVPPAETLGQHYLVASPTGPRGDAPGQVVRLHGHVDGTTLSYLGTKPPGAPATLDAGQVVDLGVVKDPFEITGSAAFVIAVFQQGGSVVDPAGEDMSYLSRGDPAMSLPTPVEQFRSTYVFLAPDDYDVSYADILLPDGTSVQLDGSPLAAPLSPVSPGYSIARALLPPTGTHTLTASAPVGLQIMGYGAYTSYQYPGGLNLRAIAPPPAPIE